MKYYVFEWYNLKEKRLKLDFLNSKNLILICLDWFVPCELSAMCNMIFSSSEPDQSANIRLMDTSCRGGFSIIV